MRVRGAVHRLTCPTRSRFRRWRYHQPLWKDDTTAAWLGIGRYGCRRCGWRAIEERDDDLKEAG